MPLTTQFFYVLLHIASSINVYSRNVHLRENISLVTLLKHIQIFILRFSVTILSRAFSKKEGTIQGLASTISLTNTHLFPNRPVQAVNTEIARVISNTIPQLSPSMVQCTGEIQLFYARSSRCFPLKDNTCYFSSIINGLPNLVDDILWCRDSYYYSLFRLLGTPFVKDVWDKGIQEDFKSTCMECKWQSMTSF